METSHNAENETPQKLKYQRGQWDVDAENATTMTTPGQNRKHRHQPNTPTASSSYNSAMQMCSSVGTPPAKRFHRVRNPFESALTDRLHLPLIGSPSLFQRPVTPQLSSTQFEWTIDHVSSLNPVNVEPHETQFQDSPDPEYEAKAQSAISSFFKEQQIVPSPVDCPLRNHRIILSELNSNTPISKPGRRIRDCASQTELTLPFVLPPSVEEALRPYFRAESICGRDSREAKMCTAAAYESSSSCITTNTTSADISLRRKLFDMHNVVVIGENGHASSPSNTNSSPLSVRSFRHNALAGKLSDSLDKSSFGSLSPISATSNSPQSQSDTNGLLRKSRMRDFLNDLDGVELSPIPGLKRERSPERKPLRRLVHSADNDGLTISASSALQYRSTNVSNAHTTATADMSVSLVLGDAQSENFTPDCSSSPMRNAADYSIDGSFNVKVSRLMMNSAKAVATPRIEAPPAQQQQLDDTMDDGLMLADDEDMHMSQSISSSSDTPRSKRRSASRKNLSQSFCRNWPFEADDMDDMANGPAERIVVATLLNDRDDDDDTKLANVKCGAAANDDDVAANAEPQLLKFFRTDSGFNDMTSSQSSSSTIPCCGESALVRSSTPSKELAIEAEDTSSNDFE